MVRRPSVTAVLVALHLLVALLCLAPRIKPRHPFAYATLLYSEDFVNATRVLFYTLLRQNAHLHADFVVLLARGWREPPVSQGARAALQALGCIVKEVETIPSPWRRVDWIRLWAQFTKLRLWELTGYDRVVYLDSDTLVLNDISMLFQLPLAAGTIAAVPDWSSFGRPSDRELNGGMLLLRPDAAMVPAMLAAARDMQPGTTLEQSFFSRYFDWQPLPPVFNAPANLFLRAPAAFSSARVVHYTHAKPWQPDEPGYEVWFREVHALWWRAYADMLRGYDFTPAE